MKDRIVAFLLFLGKIVIVCLVGKSLVCALINTLLHYWYICCQRMCGISVYVHASALCSTGIIAYLGFGPYEEQGRVLWGQPLNYYLIPVMVRTRFQSQATSDLTLSLCVDSDCGLLLHCIWIHECFPHGSGHHLHMCL